MYNVLQEFYDAFASVLETAFGNESMLALLFLPLFLACVSCMMRLIKSLFMGPLRVERVKTAKKVESKRSSSGSDWEVQLDALLYEHDESCRNVKAILEEKKR